MQEDTVFWMMTFKLLLYTYAALSIASMLFIRWNSVGGNCFCFSTIWFRSVGDRFAWMNRALMSSRRRFSRTNSCALAQGEIFGCGIEDSEYGTYLSDCLFVARCDPIFLKEE